MTKTSCDGGSAASASACASAAAVAVAVAEICIYLQVKFAFFSLLHSLLIYLLFPRFLALTHPQTHTHTPLQALTMQLKNLLPAFRLILCHFLLSIVASVAICNTVLSRRAVMPLLSHPAFSKPTSRWLPPSLGTTRMHFSCCTWTTRVVAFAVVLLLLLLAQHPAALHASACRPLLALTFA